MTIEQQIIDNVYHDMTKPLPSDLRQYVEALGQFVTMFSMVESRMQIALWRLAGVSPPLAPAIFSGTRMDAAIQHIKRISEATGWPKNQRALFDELSLQLGVINRTRNDLLHCGIEGDDAGNLLTSNALFAHIKERIRATKISAVILDQMSSDLLTIFGMLSLLIVDFSSFVLPAELQKRVWRYKAERQSGGSSQ